MMNKTIITYLLLLLICVFSIIGCSSSHTSSVLPDENNSNPDAIVPTPAVEPEDSNHTLPGVWKADFDIESLTATIEPVRDGNYHFSVLSRIEPPVISVNYWDSVDEILHVGLTIKNTTYYNVFDVRLIIYTDDAGHILENADCWTSLYDIPEGMVINPFKAYAKSMTQRNFQAQASHSENLLIKCPDENFSIQFAIDASFPGNCEEPYEIFDFTQDRLLDEVAASATIEVSVRDWQNDVDNVELYCNEISGGPVVSFEDMGEDKWQGELINNNGASAGEYYGVITASSSNSGSILLYDIVIIKVTDPSYRGWVTTMGDGSFNDCICMTVDDSGNIYAVMETGGYVDFFKLDPLGNQIWIKSWEADDYVSSTGCFPKRMIYDNLGNIYMVGRFIGCVDFDPGPGEDYHHSEYYYSGGHQPPNDYFNTHAFLLKYDVNGNYLGVRTWGGYTESGSYPVSKDTSTHDLALNSTGEILVTGYYNTDSPLFDLDPGTEEDLHTSYGMNLSSFDSNGNYIRGESWECFNGWGWGEPMSLEINNSNDIFITGKFSQNMDFDPGPGEIVLTSNGYSDIFLLKLDNNRDIQWVHAWGGNEFDEPKDITLDPSGNIYVCGIFWLGVDFDPGPDESWCYSHGWYDCFVSKFNSNGSFQWVRTWGGDRWDECHEIDTTIDGNVYYTGTFQSTVDMDPGPGEDIHTAGDKDTFVCSLNPDGDFLWARSWMTIDNSQGSLEINDDSEIIITGEFRYTVDFDPGPLVDEHTSNVFRDIFIMKLFPNGYWDY
jgi:hypothetical protein